MQFFYTDVTLAMTIADKFFFPYKKKTWGRKFSKLPPMTTDSTPTVQLQDTIHLAYLPHIEN